MTVQIRRAERRKAKLRVGMFGPSGCGKSKSSLLMASGMAPWEKVCVVDTENGSADLYSDLGPYSVITLEPPYDPRKYAEAIEAAGKAGFEVIIVDSITHEWAGTGGMLELADQMQQKVRDGRLAWMKVTPWHNRFMDAILQSPAHVICCGRSKQEHVIGQKEVKGLASNQVEKLGLKAVTREGFDYEMTVSFDIDMRHLATCSKDRTMVEGRALFQDRPAQVIDRTYGERLMEWANGGSDAPARCDSCREKEGIVTEITVEEAEATRGEFGKALCARHLGVAREWTKKKDRDRALEDCKARMSPLQEWMRAIQASRTPVALQAVMAGIEADAEVPDKMKDTLKGVADAQKAMITEKTDDEAEGNN